MTTDERLIREIEARSADLVALTQDLVRIPSLNPPGRHYREVCDLIAGRLEASGFVPEFIRAEGVLGDSEEYPRWNVVSRREGTAPGDCVHFTGHVDVVEVGQAGRRIRSAARCTRAGSMAAAPAI